VPFETDVLTQDGWVPASPHRAIDVEEIRRVIGYDRRAAERAKAAGLDGVELHAANGYLVDTFLQDGTSLRTDAHGGSIAKRARLMLELVEVLVSVWGADRVGVRLSPSRQWGSVSDSDPQATFSHAARELDKFGLAYLHIIEPRVKGVVTLDDRPPVAAEMLRKVFSGAIIAAVSLEVPVAVERLRPLGILWRHACRLHGLSVPRAGIRGIKPPVHILYRCRMRILVALLLWVAATCAMAAQVAGVVVQVSGAMSARSPSGAVKALQARSEVESGDTLITAAGAYALVRFIDNSELTLKPGTTVVVDQFSFDSAKPESDRAAFTLVKGGLRSVTGLLGKRSKEKFAVKTPSATIGIRGTTFFLEYLTVPASGLEPGLHVHVSAGGISIVNSAGEFRYDPGQFGYIKDDRSKPVKMFANPGMQFAPPASFGEADTLIP
jgi:hypothetical protein